VLDDIAINAPAAVPVAGGADDRVGRVAAETQPVVADGVADGIKFAVAVGV